jgi:hypothetical protein
METIDDETSAAAIDYMRRQHTAGKPFFVWFNSTRMHLRTHVRAEHRGRYRHGNSEYVDGISSTTTRSAACSRRSTTWASPTIPSSSTRATTVRT